MKVLLLLLYLHQHVVTMIMHVMQLSSDSTSKSLISIHSSMCSDGDDICDATFIDKRLIEKEKQLREEKIKSTGSGLEVD